MELVQTGVAEAGSGTASTFRGENYFTLESARRAAVAGRCLPLPFRSVSALIVLIQYLRSLSH